MKFNGIVNNINYNYFIKDKYEAGIILLGWEVKSLRASSNIQLINSYVVFKEFEPWLISSIINPIRSICNHIDVLKNRRRKLLLKKKEINYLYSIYKRKGFSLLPHRLYVKNSFFKIELCVCVGKKNKDKREIIKKRENERAINVVQKMFCRK